MVPLDGEKQKLFFLPLFAQKDCVPQKEAERKSRQKEKRLCFFIFRYLVDDINFITTDKRKREYSRRTCMKSGGKYFGKNSFWAVSLE